jgi:hypothetical protein
MAYRDFKFSDLEHKFNVKQTSRRLFQTGQVAPVEPSDILKAMMKRAIGSALTTEKAVSEALVFPILQEIRYLNQDFIELFSGENLEAEKSTGLNGECDFILAKAPHSKELKAPIINITEAKRGDIGNARSLSQTAAQLIGAKVFNQKQGFEYPQLYGACTSGFEWVFMTLETDTIYIDVERYSIRNLPELLGILQFVVNSYQK